MSRLAFGLMVFCTALVVCAGRAEAQIPSTGGVFEACIQLVSGGSSTNGIRLVAATETCKTQEIRVSWNQVGQPGADGTSVTFKQVFSGSGYGCTNGGIVFTDGTTDYAICHGVDGANGDKGDKGDPGDPGSSADGPCWDNTNRYVDCGNGTVTDTVTGLVWLKDLNCLGTATFAAANQAAAALKEGDCGLTDGSSAGDWRLPTTTEWTTTMARAGALGCIFANAPSLTDDAGTACYSAGGPSSFAGLVAGHIFWSSTTAVTTPTSGGEAIMNLSVTSAGSKVFLLSVWPVRGPSR